MSCKFGFKVCRVCLAPEPAIKLMSMFEGRGEMADLFQIVSGCSLSFNRGKHEAMICPKCSIDVKKTFDLLEKIRQADAHYFQSRRDEADEDDFRREQAVVEISQAETVSQVEVSNSPSGSAISPVSKASRMKSKVQDGLTQLNSFTTAAKPVPGKHFKCHVCDKILTRKYYLLQHIKAVHEKIKNFACKLCPAKFSHKHHLQRHNIKIHNRAHNSNKI